MKVKGGRRKVRCECEQAAGRHMACVVCLCSERVTKVVGFFSFEKSSGCHAVRGFHPFFTIGEKFHLV